MGLESFINVVLSSTSGAQSQASFGSVLILGGEAANTAIPASEKFRTYSSLASLAADFDSTDVEYKVAQRIFAQTPRAKSVLVARRATMPSQAFTLTPTVANSTAYSFELDDEVKTYTSDATATAAEIVAGLAALFPTGATGFTATAGATSLRVVAGTAGAWHQVRVLTPSALAIAQDGADVTVADVLDDLVLQGADFYGVVTPFASRAEVLAIAAWVEAARKFFFVTLVDSAHLGAVDTVTPDSDTGNALKVSAYIRTVAMWAAANDSFVAEGALGYLLGTNAGSVTLNLKTVAGAPVYPLTDSQVTNLKARNMPVYHVVGGANVIERPLTAGGEWADVVRDTDEFVTRTQEDIFTNLRTADKVPFTNEGIAVITNALGGRAMAGIGSGFLSNDADRKPVVTAPLASAVSTTDRANRNLPGVTLTAYIAGAIHSVDPLTITFNV